MRVQVLVKRVYSVYTDSPVPLDEWGRDAVVTQVQNDSCSRLFTFVHDAQVMVVRALTPHRLCDYDVRTFDFSQRGRAVPFHFGAGPVECRGKCFLKMEWIPGSSRMTALTRGIHCNHSVAGG